MTTRLGWSFGLGLAVMLGCPGGNDSDTSAGDSASTTGTAGSPGTQGSSAGAGTNAATSGSGEAESSASADTGETTGSVGPGGCEGESLLELPADPAARGPWAVGVQTLELPGLTLPTEVWYPAAPGSDDGATPVEYDLRQWLPPSQRDIIPDSDNPLQPCDCYRDLPLDAEHGPYPVVVFVHGTAAWRAQSATLVTHLASRGFVVLSSDHPGLFLGDNLALVCPDEATGAQDLRADHDALITALSQTSDGLSFLAGNIDVARLGVTGHSAGGNAASMFSGDPGVQVAIPLASGQPTTGAGVSTLFMGGLSDGVVAYSSTQNGYASSPAPKRLVGLSNAGHLAFSDICEIANGNGSNILEVATDYGICGAQFAGVLFDCNPDFLPAELAREIIAFSVTAVLEDVLHCNGAAQAHFAELQGRFPQVGEMQEQL